ncbi:MAG: hypothetical protein NVSMB25_07520 [Thermoleophilaceae bacterium]
MVSVRGNRWRGSLLVLLLATAAAALPSEASSGVSYGIQMHPLWDGESVSDFDRGLDAVRAAGADSVRIDIGWSTLEAPGKDHYSHAYYSKADTFLRDARARGIKVVATLWSTPCWASSAPPTVKQNCTGRWWERGVDRYPPTNPGDYADAASWIAHRWGSKLQGLELWNEPNALSFLNSPHQAADYVALVRAAYPRIKAASRSLPVVAGSLQWADWRFLRTLYAYGLKGSYDVLSIHPYDDASRYATTRDPTYSLSAGVPAVRRQMTDHLDSATPLWLTEFGWPTCPVVRSPRCLSQQLQARNLSVALGWVTEWRYVGAATFYELRDESARPIDPEQSFGLLTSDFTQKPAYKAFSRSPGHPEKAAVPFGADVVGWPPAMPAVPLLPVIWAARQGAPR